MFNQFGLSVYLSTFDEQIKMLESFAGSGYFVFTSFHIQEEYNKLMNYQELARAMCKWLKSRKFSIIGDVSTKSLTFFNMRSIVELAQELEIDILRLDYGFSLEEVINIAKEYPISVNPSTEDILSINKILDAGGEIYALHNFYPRPETGLDPEVLEEINAKIRKLGIKTLAFIPGDEQKRTPLYQGLPTIEKHRWLPPYVAFLDLVVNYEVDSVFVGDVQISQQQGKLITEFIQDGIIRLPVKFLPPYKYLYGQIFSIRIDSPKALMRLQESREYSCDGAKRLPQNTIPRTRGAITMDNLHYKRYSGEIQILRKDFSADPKINVIGRLDPDYMELMDCVKNSGKIKFINL